MAVRENEVIKNMEVLKEEYLGWINIEKRISTNFEGVDKQVLGYKENYFVTAEYNGKTVYFLKFEEFFDNKKTRTFYMRADKNQNIMPSQGEDEWVEDGKIYNDEVWYDL